MAGPAYNILYASVPFVPDAARVVRLQSRAAQQFVPEEQQPPRDQQPLVDLIDELNLLIPFDRLQDQRPSPSYPGRNLGALATYSRPRQEIVPNVRIGEWWYPNGARRWSVFRGLATSKMAAAMLANTKGGLATFTMEVMPEGPGNITPARYTLESRMYMLPPRPLAEHGGKFEGLYLITLVDQRYYWQFSSVSLRVTQSTTWDQLINQLASALNATIQFNSTPMEYGQPEPDSQLWSNLENAAELLDVVAHNTGRTVCRLLNGTYVLQTSVEARNSALTSRGSVLGVFRTAGGNIFEGPGTRLQAGDLTQAKNSVVPASVIVGFPKYVAGQDPVPHFVNARNQNQRPSAWYEDGFGELYQISVPLASGDGPPLSGGVAQSSGLVGVQPVSGSLLSGINGVTNVSHSLKTTAKALYTTEANAASGAASPANSSGLLCLALSLARNYYYRQVAAALDEVYPGTYAWTPDGIHDIVWTWSARARQATTRVMRPDWNLVIEEFQHGTPPDGTLTFTDTPPGVGGHTVAQTWRDSFSGQVNTQVIASGRVSPGSWDGTGVASGDKFVRFADISYFPTQNRWRGRIDNEEILFEGTSGGIEAAVNATSGCCNCVNYTGNFQGTAGCPPATLTLLFAGSGTLVPGVSGGCQWVQAQSGLTALYIVSGSNASLSLVINGAIGCTLNYLASGLVSGNCDGIVLNFNQGSSVPSNLNLPPITLSCVAGSPSPITSSGGPVSGGYRVDVVYRGIDGTAQVSHLSGAGVLWDTSDRAYAVNLVTQEKMHWAFPHEWTSGGVNGVREVPVLQSIKVFENTGTTLNGITHYSGAVHHYDTTLGSGNTFVREEMIWAVERNGLTPLSGSLFGGQFAGFSKVPQAAPVYLFEAGGACSCTSGSGGTQPTPTCCPCDELDFSITGLDPTLCGGNGSYALTQKNSCNCCMWCSPLSSAPGGGEACLTMKPGPAGSLGVLEICTAANCCATYRGIVSDCNNFTLNLCDTCGSGGAGWPQSVTITCGCVPGACGFCTSPDPPQLFTVAVPASFFGTAPLNLFNGTNWVLKNLKPCVWSQCQTATDGSGDILCMTLTVLGPANSQLQLVVTDSNGSPISGGSTTLVDTVDPANGNCCNNFVFGQGGGGNCCTCADYQFDLTNISAGSPCFGMACVYDLAPVSPGGCTWKGNGSGGGQCNQFGLWNPHATLTQNPGNPNQWTLFIQRGGGGCEVTYTGTSTGCGPIAMFQSNNPNYPSSVTVKCVSGGGGSGGGATLTAIPTCCNIATVATPCCPNQIRKQLHYTIQMAGSRPCNVNGMTGALNWFAAGTGPCPLFPGAGQSLDYWFASNPVPGTADLTLNILMYCDTKGGQKTWKIFPVCSAQPPNCSTFYTAFVNGAFFSPSQAANCTLPTFIFGIGTLTSCCGAGGSVGTITVTN